MPTLNLSGAQLTIISPIGQPLEVLFDFGKTDISSFTWLGQVRSDPLSDSPLTTFTFSNPTSTQLLATIAEDELAVGAYLYEIEQVAPTHRQMFYGRLTITQDIAR